MRNRWSILTIVVASLTVVFTAALSVTPGCSVTQQFANTSSPLAADMAGDILQYQPDNAAAKDLASKFMAASNAGDKPTVVAVWYGDGTEANPGFRATYTYWLSTDKLFTGVGGERLKNIKYRNVVAFDYVLSIGNAPAK